MMMMTRKGVATGMEGEEWCRCPRRQSPKGDKIGSKTNILSEKNSVLKNI